ncbi:DUF488 family protein [Rosistilla oblonga]|uniref:DUF488 domain-containing protein n=1 Tax=Rosistilla oblonga TaxID=2527990 RepID=A0A518J0U5_9BACT|nr:DUF488 domain-containing protein [Rosistilla oblonga]QDV58961.1 hypothetical protein Mal33_49860 [Rosistilla oblonga]
MLHRQKAILQLLQSVGRLVSPAELTAWAFLLRHEFPSAGGSAFYDFVPYTNGAASFALDQELGKLTDQGFLVRDEEGGFTVAAGAEFQSPDDAVQKDLSRLVERFGDGDTEKLLDYVDNAFPAYTVGSNRKRLAQRLTADPAVYTAGYEGLSIDAFLNHLVENGIRRVIDVRNNPNARRYGFHRSTLQRLTGQLEIEYLHLPELGIKADQRQHLDTIDDRKALFDRYEKSTLEENTAAIDRVAELMLQLPSVLVCLEADPVCCHRSRIAKRVAERTSLPIQNL